MEFIFEGSLKNGGTVNITKERMAFQLPFLSAGISTSPFGGGLQLYDGIFNQRLIKQIQTEEDLPGGSLENYLELSSKGLGYSQGTGLLTSAQMDCYGYFFGEGKKDWVEIYVTAGMGGNAARAGDPPLYRESEGGYLPIGGTVNLLVFLSVSLEPGILARTLITLTEAKAAVAAEMGIPSIATGYTATGTSTDGIIVITNPNGPQRSDVGTYSELGYLLSEGVKQGIREALPKESGIPNLGGYSLYRQLHCRPYSSRDYEELVKKMVILNKADQEELEKALSIWLVLKEANHFEQIPDLLFQKETQLLLERYPVLRDWIWWYETY